MGKNRESVGQMGRGESQFPFMQFIHEENDVKYSSDLRAS